MPLPLLHLMWLAWMSGPPFADRPLPADARVADARVADARVLRAVAPQQGVVDDAFSWFEAENTEALDEKQAPVSTGWTLRSYVRVFGEYPARSAMKMVLSKAGKEITSTRCETSQYRRTGNAVDFSTLVTADCWRKDRATKLFKTIGS